MKFIFKEYGFPKILLQNRMCLVLLKNSLKSWSIVFFGTDSFSATTLKGLYRYVYCAKVVLKLSICSFCVSLGNNKLSFQKLILILQTQSNITMSFTQALKSFNNLTQTPISHDYKGTYFVCKINHSFQLKLPPPAVFQKTLFKNIEVVTVNNCNPVYNFAISNNIKVQEWPPLLIGSHDFGVVVSFGKLIPKDIIEHFSLLFARSVCICSKIKKKGQICLSNLTLWNVTVEGIINVHPSLLPQWRGAMPIVHSLKNGDTVTGITIIKIKHDKFDTGDIILRKSCSIGNNELFPSLYNRLSKFGSECLLEVIGNMPECLKGAASQSNENITYARKLTKKASIVNWNLMAATEIYNLYRALFGLYELETTWKGRRVNLVCISLNELDKRFSSDLKEVPGSVQYRAGEKCLIVQCKDKSVRICTLRLNGKLYSAFNFYLGFLTQTSKACWTFGD